MQDMARVFIHSARQSLQFIERGISRGKDVASRKLILRAFAAADAVFKFAVSLASSVRLKAQAKLMRFTHYKKGYASHCIYSTFEKASSRLKEIGRASL